MESVSVLVQIVALVIAASTVLTAVFNARRGAEDTLQTLVKQQGARIAELEAKVEARDKKIEERDRMIDERDLRIDELERRVNVLSSELQKITHPKMKVGRMKKK